MRHRTLQDILQANRLLWHISPKLLQRFQMLIEVELQITAEGVYISTAGSENFLTMIIEQHGIKDMLSRQVFMVPALGLANGEGKSYLYILIEHTLVQLHEKVLQLGSA